VRQAAGVLAPACAEAVLWRQESPLAQESCSTLYVHEERMRCQGMRCAAGAAQSRPVRRWCTTPADAQQRSEKGAYPCCCICEVFTLFAQRVEALPAPTMSHEVQRRCATSSRRRFIITPARYFLLRH